MRDLIVVVVLLVNLKYELAEAAVSRWLFGRPHALKDWRRTQWTHGCGSFGLAPWRKGGAAASGQGNRRPERMEGPR